ncbi:hypothetical protein JXA56_00355 [Candidatus Micrarchaeota archaeon]|nr:hypothetical protein [Candidatus Micrarchaeota archaeon]
MRKFLPILAFAVLSSDRGPAEHMPALKKFPKIDIKIEKHAKKPEQMPVPKPDAECKVDGNCGYVLPKASITIEENGKGVYRGIITRVWNIRIQMDENCRVTDETALIMIDDSKSNTLIQANVREGECIKRSNGCLAIRAEDISYDISESCEPKNKKITLSFSASKIYW